MNSGDGANTDAPREEEHAQERIVDKIRNGRTSAPAQNKGSQLHCQGQVFRVSFPGARTGLQKERKPTRKLVAEFVRIRAAGWRNVGSLTTSATNPFFRPSSPPPAGVTYVAIRIRQTPPTNNGSQGSVLPNPRNDVAVLADALHPLGMFVEVRFQINGGRWVGVSRFLHLLLASRPVRPVQRFAQT